MNMNGLIFIPFRFFSRSCCRPRLFGKDTPKSDKLNIREEVQVPVEKDTQRLATYVCGTNLFSEGGEDVKIKPDSEYPDWLWSMTAPLPLEEMDKNSKTYWNRVGRIREKEIKYLKSLLRTSSVHK